MPAPVSAITRGLPIRLASSAEPIRQPPGVVNRGRPADVVLELVLELGDELRILAAALVRPPELVERVHQRLGDEHPAVLAEMPALVRKVNHLHSLLLR